MAALDPPRDAGTEEERAPASVPSGVQPRLVGPAGEVGPDVQADLFGSTDRGRVRATNQDQFLIAELRRALVVVQSSTAARAGRRSEASQGWLLAVADGMGGYQGGGLASSVAISSLAAFALELSPWLVASGAALRDHLLRSLELGVRGADEAVHRTAVELDLDERMGTTLTAAYVVWPQAYVLHVGDSRAHLIRGSELVRLTRDHTVAQELLAAHALDAGQAARSQLRHVLVNTVGGQRDKELTVDVGVVDLVPGDTLLLCTDGVAAHVTDEELPGLIRDASGAEAAARAVIDTVTARGALDNVTVVVARF